MISPIFFIIVFVSFLVLFALQVYSFEKETWTLTKYLIVFYFGMTLGEVFL